jgi:hypothetical protein
MTIDELIERKGYDHEQLIRFVDSEIRNSHPGIQLQRKYGVPFYVLKKNLFYLDVQKGIPILGVVYGIKMKSELGFLDFTGRTQIGHLQLQKLDENLLLQLRQVIHTAIEFDLNR